MGVMYFPGEKPSAEDRAKMMDKESWIQSRTDKPDRLGRDCWERMYDESMEGGRPFFNIPENIKKQMTREFLSKNGLTYNDESRWEHVFVEVGNFAKNQPCNDELLEIFAQDGVRKKKSSKLEGILRKGEKDYAVTAKRSANAKGNKK